MLIVPVMHYSNSRELELITDEEGLSTVKSIQEEISKIKTEVESVFRKKGQCVVFFEVFGGGDQNSPNTRVHHMHIQMVPIPEELEEMVEDAFKTEAENEGLIAQEALPESSFWPFIRVHLFGRTPIVFTPPEPTDGVLIPFNLQMARFVLANLIGKPEYANWKRCILEEDEETAQAESLRNILSLE
ncbi:hypothetical protein HDV02_003681 [Globomyces sp. JEL0801]|nr:hypothetical protein HDV02_003681 [Globomyces sp. JEL0801]